MAPMLRPTYHHGAIEHGRVRGGAVVAT
jgi:hypothetical protein